MKPEKLTQMVDEIIACKGDPEIAHGREDDLHLQLIHTFCPPWVSQEIRRLSEAEFPRWCA